MKYRIDYLLYVWLVTVLTGVSLNYWGYLLIVNNLPGGFIHVLATWTNLTTQRLKTWIALVAIALCVMSFVYFVGLDDAFALNIFLCFAIPLVASIYFFKLRD